MNPIQVLIYEDREADGFGALTSTRAVWGLRCGAFTMGERLRRLFKGAEVAFHLRKALAPLYVESGLESERANPRITARPALFVSGRAWMNRETAQMLLSGSGDAVYLADGKPVAFRITRKLPTAVRCDAGEPLDPRVIPGLEPREIKATLICHPWELVERIGEAIEADLELVDGRGTHPIIFPSDTIIRGITNISSSGRCSFGPGATIDAERSPILIEDGVFIGAGAIVSSHDGPVWLAEGVRMEAGAVISGPTYVGPGSIVRPGARLYDGVSLGPQCRVGGEITRSVFQGYSNKQHSGYLGNSYVGSWVNLGAATDVSDLKNNYRPIQVSINGTLIDTGRLHVGVFIGDFTRTAIQTRLNSGTMVGVCCNILGPDFPARELPPFIWAGAGRYEEYRLDKALETIAAMMPRRGCRLTPALQSLLKRLFEESSDARSRFISAGAVEPPE